MDSTDIFNKLAVNCEVSQAEVHLPYMAKHLRSNSDSGSSSNSSGSTGCAASTTSRAAETQRQLQRW